MRCGFQQLTGKNHFGEKVDSNTLLGSESFDALAAGRGKKKKKCVIRLSTVDCRLSHEMLLQGGLLRSGDGAQVCGPAKAASHVAH